MCNHMNSHAILGYNCIRYVLKGYVTVHGKTNHIALGFNLRYEPNKLPG